MVLFDQWDDIIYVNICVSFQSTIRQLYNDSYIIMPTPNPFN